MVASGDPQTYERPVARPVAGRRTFALWLIVAAALLVIAATLAALPIAHGLEEHCTGDIVVMIDAPLRAGPLDWSFSTEVVDLSGDPIPPGTYDVSLVTSDPGHAQPGDVSQPAEIWYVELLDADTSPIYTSEWTTDLADTATERIDAVQPQAVLESAAITLVARHAIEEIERDGNGNIVASGINSLTAVCAIFNSVSMPVLPLEVGIAAEVDPGSVTVGAASPATFQLSISNIGQAPAGELVIDQPLCGDVTGQTLAPGGVVTVSCQVDVSHGGVLDLRVTGVSDGRAVAGETMLAVLVSELMIEPEAPLVQGTQGGSATIEGVIRDSGTVALAEVTPAVTGLPAGVTASCGAAPDLAPDQESSFTCSLAGVAAGGSAFDVAVGVTAVSANPARVAAADTATVTVVPWESQPALTIEITPETITVTEGDTVQYTVVVGAAGINVPIDVMVDTPADQCSRQIPAGAAFPDVLTCEVVATNTTTIDATATADTGGAQPLTATDVSTLIVEGLVDIELDVSLDEQRIDVGDTVEMRVLVRNLGPAKSGKVTVEIDLPSTIGTVRCSGPPADTFVCSRWVIEDGLEKDDQAVASYILRGAAAGSDPIVAEVVEIEGARDTDSEPDDQTGDDHDSEALIVERPPNRIIPRGTISGCVFLDDDEDGELDTGEELLDGVRVFSGSSSDLTAGSGYSFRIEAGTYRVAVDVDTLPGLFDFSTPATRLVTVRANRTTSDICFGVVPTGVYTFTLTADPAEIQIDSTAAVSVLVDGPDRPDVPVIFDPLPGGLELVGPRRVDVTVGEPFDVEIKGEQNGRYLISARAQTDGVTGPVATTALIVMLPPSKIGGTVFVDSDGDGVLDPDEEPPADASTLRVLAIKRDKIQPAAAQSAGSGLGYYGSGVLQSRISLFQGASLLGFVFFVDENGRYVTETLTPGKYQLELIDSADRRIESLPEGRQIALPRDAGNHDLDFAVTAQLDADRISGRVWIDENGNGEIDDGERGWGGAMVTISDLDGNTEPQIVTTELVAGDEARYDAVVEPGRYRVSIADQGGAELGFSTAHPIDVEVPGGIPFDQVDFGVTDGPFGVISGGVWCDVNDNGTLDQNETSFPGVVTLGGPVGQRTATVQADGHYEFSGLSKGDYTVAYTQQRSEADPIEKNETVTLGLAEVRNDVDLKPCPKGSIGGIIYVDENNSGSFEEGADRPARGISVQLWHSGAPISERAAVEVEDVREGEAARYLFQHLAPGLYRVVVIGAVDDATLAIGRRTPVTIEPGSTERVDLDVRFTTQSGIPLWVWVLLGGAAALAILYYLTRHVPVPMPVPIPGSPPTDRGPPTPTPYPGVRPFGPAEAPVFAGREREIRALEALTYPNRILLLYGPAGAGKTSLLQAGYIPALDPTEFEVLPTARFQLGPPRPPTDGANVFSYAVLSYLSQSAVPAAATLADYLDQRPPIVGEFDVEVARVIVIDEFQEMFRLYPEYWHQRQSFFDQIGEALESDPLVRFVLCIDEHEMGELEPFIEQFGPHVVSEYRIEPLRPEQALAAISHPAELDGRRMSEAAAAALVDEARTVRAEHDGHRIEVVYEHADPMALQLSAEATWRHADGDEIGPDDIVGWEDGDAAIEAFYESIVAAVAPQAGEAALREWCERVLIDPTGNRAVLVPGRGGARQMPADVIESLTMHTLLVGSVRGDVRWLELAHDRLVPAIELSNRKWREQTLIEASAGLLSAAARIWERHGRDEDGLLVDGALTDARLWAAAYPTRVGPLEREYLEASIAASERPVGS